MTDLTINTSLPSKEAIDGLKTLSDLPLSEPTMSIVPNPVLVELPNEEFYNFSLFEREISSLSATSNIAQIRICNKQIQVANALITNIYKRRSISKALSKFISATRDVILKEALPFFEDIFGLCKNIMTFCDQGVDIIHKLFDQHEIWQKGHYSDTLIDTLCLLFYRLSAVDEMKLVKSSLVNDLTNFKNYALGKQDDENINRLRIILPTRNYIDNKLMEVERARQKTEKKAISDILTTHIIHKIEKAEFLKPEMLYAYIRLLMFLGRYNELDSKTLQFLADQCSHHPLLPLAFEVTINVQEYCKPIPHFDREFGRLTDDPKQINNSLNKYVKILESSTLELPSIIDMANSSKISGKKLYKFLINLLNNIAHTKNTLREQLANKLANPPPKKSDEDKNQSNFERSIRKGYSEDELKTLLKLIMLWRSLCDTLRQSTVIIIKTLSSYISHDFQEFVKGDCHLILRKTRSSFEPKMKDIITNLVSMAGDFTPSEPLFPEKKQKKFPPPNIPQRNAHPQLSVIEFIRIQIQHLFNPSSEFMKGGTKKLFKKDKPYTHAIKFLENSAYWSTILQFDQILNHLADQSDLYFKEVQLDLNNTINFPIRSSLPYVLSEFALHNFMNPELTDMLFYPIGIYDDAARVAEQVLQSRFLLDEIRAESNMCMTTLTMLVTDFTYDSFRTFTALRWLPSSFPNPTQKNEIKSLPQSRAYRLSALLKLDNLYLHYTQIDIRSLLSNQLELAITSDLEGLSSIASNTGVSAMIAIDKGVEIVRETHRRLVEEGLTLPSFDVLLRTAFGSAVPNASVSKFATNIVRSITKKLPHHTYLRTNPLRLCSIKSKTLSKTIFGQSSISKVLQAALNPSLRAITVEHFCSIGLYLGYSSVNYLISEFMKQFEDCVDIMIARYQEVLVKSGLKRISDLPIDASAQLVFDRYEGAYSSFGDEDYIINFFEEMQALGNMLALANMIDIGLSSSRLTRAQIIGFFKGRLLNEDKEANNSIKFLPDELSDFIKNDKTSIPNGRDVYPLLLTKCLAKLRERINNSLTIFDETSNTILDFTSLTGFASVWSVLEFIFIYNESLRTENIQGSFEIYGEGVMLAASAIILALKQERIYLATNIGRRIQRVKEIDFSANKNMKLLQFCAVNQYEYSSMEWSLSTFQAIMRQIYSPNYSK